MMPESEALRIVLPYIASYRTAKGRYMASPLSVNHAYKRGRNGRVYLDPEAAKWKMALANEVNWQMWNVWERPTWTADTLFTVRVSGRFKNERSACDLGNLEKLVCDGVGDGLELPNDKELRFQAGDRVIGVAEPEIIVEIQPVRVERAREMKERRDAEG